MKKDIIAVILLVVAVVFGLGVRYYMQTGSLLPEEQIEPAQEIVQESDSVNMTEEITEEVSGEVTEEVSGNQVRTPGAPDNDWGVVLSAADVTPDGMTLVCAQNDGNPTGELMTGAWYELEVSDSGQWQPVTVLTASCWIDVAWLIPLGETTQWEVNWTWVYGTLPAGEYRIAKEIMDFRQTGDFDTCKSYAYFVIE